VAAALTNTQWRKLCDAAGRRPKAVAEAREMLSAVLFDEYPAFRYDPEAVARDHERAQQMVEHLDAFAELYRQRWLPHLPVDEFQAIITRRAFPVANKREYPALYWIGMLRLLAVTLEDRVELKRHTDAKNRSAQREWLYRRLCDVWLDYFEGPELPAGRARTPLVNFMLEAMRQIRTRLTLPRPDTVRDNIERERQARDPARLRARRAQLERLRRERSGD
jgi:hypothetical protein